MTSPDKAEKAEDAREAARDRRYYPYLWPALLAGCLAVLGACLFALGRWLLS